MLTDIHEANQYSSRGQNNVKDGLVGVMWNMSL